MIEQQAVARVGDRPTGNRTALRAVVQRAQQIVALALGHLICV